MNSNTLLTVIENFLYFNGSLAMLFAIIHLILLRTAFFKNKTLAALLFCLSILFFQIAFLTGGLEKTVPEVMFFHLTLVNMIIPLSYFAYHITVFPVESLPKNKIILFIPAFIALVFDIAFILISRESRIIFLNEYFSNNCNWIMTIIKALFIGSGIQIIIFHGILTKKFITQQLKEPGSPLLMITIVSVVSIVLGTEVVIAGYVLGSLTLITWGMVALGIIFFISKLIGVKHPSLIQLFINGVKEKYGNRAMLKNIDSDALIYQLQRLMINEELYKREELNLRELADYLDITPHQLSHLLNENLKTNFNNYVNQMRVEMAKSMLIEDKKRSILDIAFDVGFNSKSTFYDAFSKFVGKSPKQFRQEN